MNNLKYEYGVEYKTNGEKPDLPGDVLVRVMFYGSWTDPDIVDYWIWCGSRKFRIVDERWKPKPNDWHKRGELPPVGEICNYKTSSGKSTKIEITAHSRMGICFCEVGRDGESYVSKGRILNFAPIRTERDVLVEKAKSDFIQAKVGGHTVYEQRCIEALIDAGWRPVKQQSEVEFINQCVDIRERGSTSLYRSLYLAGCRFIEVSDE